VEEDTIVMECDPTAVSEMREALTAKGYTVLSAEAEKVPANYTQLTDEDSIKKMQLLLDHLEENDDVQNVYHNWEMPEDAE
ncbi:MAG: YebC/PmpR family DNA-binding transcriptional regulator, partial [Oscillospiraceae bacterium]|nr:YebC/PmpR family DNA-binding transcriptional regulator [Oscillospiraceae bacterium]